MAYSLNGSSQYLATSTVPTINYPLAFSAWIYLTDVTSTYDIFSISTPSDATGNSYLCLRIRGDLAGDPASIQSGTGALAYTTTGVTVNTWHHVYGYVFNAASRGVYIDGGSFGSNTTSHTWIGSTVANIGATQLFSTVINYFPGYIAEAAFWSGGDVAPHSADVISALASGYSPLFWRKQLQMYYPMIGRRTTEFNITQHYDMTLYGSPSAAPHPRIIYPSRTQQPMQSTAAPASTARSFAVFVG